MRCDPILIGIKATIDPLYHMETNCWPYFSCRRCWPHQLRPLCMCFERSHLVVELVIDEIYASKLYHEVMPTMRYNILPGCTCWKEKMAA